MKHDNQKIAEAALATAFRGQTFRENKIKMTWYTYLAPEDSVDMWTTTSVDADLCGRELREVLSSRAGRPITGIL